MLTSKRLAETDVNMRQDVKHDVKRQNRHTDVMHESRLAPPCKTTLPSPGRAHGNPGGVCKKTFVFPFQFVT